MCGIAVSIDLERRGRAIPWALDHLRHRGPDGEGVACDHEGNVVLEHCRLAIIDPDNPEADQPFSDSTGRWTIVYNGEIFNFKEIRAELEQAGVRFRTDSDTEVLLLGFVREGEQILERLRGMFAFVIWDRDTGEIFAARDQIGVKPFYYALFDGRFVASSEVRALLACPGFKPVLDPVGIVEFLAFGENLGERTVIEGVRRLLPGHLLRIRRGRLSLVEYWDVVPLTIDVPSNGLAPAELLGMLDDAVAASLVSDVPLGLMLSGGIDSSAIAALAVRHAVSSELTAYSVAFGRVDDEVAAARRLAHDLDIELREIRVTEDEIRCEFEDWLASVDYPTGNPTWIASSFIARAAHSDGIKVLLSGDGGDELFGGYTRWMKYLRFHDLLWKRAPGPLRSLGGRAVRPLVSGLAGDIARRAAEGRDLFVPSRPFHDDLLSRCLGSVGRQVAHAHPPETRIEDLRRQFDERLPGGDYLAWMSYVALKTSLVEDFLQRLDKMGMRHSVEGRVPLLDPAVARWALALPQKTKVASYRQKAALRAAVQPLLPSYVLERPKQGFCPPVAAWCERLLLDRHPREDGSLFESSLLSREGVAQLRSRTTRHPFALWTLGMLTEWVERNLETSGVGVPEVMRA